MRVVWDQIGERFFKTGTDRAVIYTYENGYYTDGVAWNGIKSVNNDISGRDLTPLYTGGIRSGVLFSGEEYGGSITCYTYPDKFEKCLGGEEVVEGLYIYDQGSVPFGLTYRTLRGNDTAGHEYGYDIHLIYRSFVTKIQGNSNTLDSNITPEEMGFDFTSLPEEASDYKPVSHLKIRSDRISTSHLQILENMLYGTPEANPRLPLPEDIIELFTEV